MRRTLGASFGIIALLSLGCLWPQPWIWALNLAPGQARQDLASLDPAFAACLSDLLADMQAAGHHPLLREAWRDPTRQRLYHLLGGSQRAQGSLHQNIDPQGKPAALAVDLVDAWPILDIDHAAAFFLALRDRAPAHGLVTGGSWRRRDPRWARYDLGWDPAHVEVADRRRCQTAPRP